MTDKGYSPPEAVTQAGRGRCGVLTVKNIAEQLRISAGIVYGWVNSGRLACVRLGAAGKRGAIRVREADLTAFLESLKQGGRQPEPPPSPEPKPRGAFKHLRLS
jgi:excisionase family DNA binding protein